jgi:hypothetical protein
MAGVLRGFLVLVSIARGALFPNPSPENAERPAVEFGVEISEGRGATCDAAAPV